MKKIAQLITIFFVLMSALSACGNGGTGAGTPAVMTKATLKLITSGTDTTIYGIDVTVNLASGVTLKSTNPPYIDSNVITLSDIASYATITAVYTAATSSIPGRVRVLVATGNGFSTGQFCSVNGNIAEGHSPKSTDFSLVNFSASDVGGNVISGLTAELTAEIK